ncbi:hypothetical protein [Swaminathania salitolerans]|uniref:Uncharacterized protein n=1 Tax=Swaminathania salitolerans TaxID=182838 RepID=A0A511BSD0_9PROT|nr:hypothetical protein [Swaminathania salitolerans]GBQ12890.1 hypothetical protein AA21291_1332 [Swaminathania salitolerans LMG 21291]GEL03200.1 hypothetical protein SSA02_23630 [Swaminathania salitolerans]
MQDMIIAVFDTVSHAQTAVDDLLVCDVPSGLIQQYCLPLGADPVAAIREDNAYHRPMGAWTWLINDHPPPEDVKTRQAMMFEQCRLRNDSAVVTIRAGRDDPEGGLRRRILRILADHAPREILAPGGRIDETASRKTENRLDPSAFQTETPVEMTEFA